MGVVEGTWKKEEVQNWANEKLGEVEKEVGNYIQTTLNIFMLASMVLSPYREGTLKHSHTTEFGGLEGVMYPLAEHSIFVILGTNGPYPIAPVNKLALWWPGALHPVQRVTHPGIKANDYIADAKMEAEAGLIAEDNNLLNWLVT